MIILIMIINNIIIHYTHIYIYTYMYTQQPAKRCRRHINPTDGRTRFYVSHINNCFFPWDTKEDITNYGFYYSTTIMDPFP